MGSGVAAIPFLGSGIGYRREIADALKQRKDEVDFVEIITDQFTRDAATLESLEELRKSFVVIPHGIGLSIGTASPLDVSYLERIKVVADMVDPPYYSEHLCMTRAPGIDIGHLAPLWYTEEVLETVIRNVAHVQEYLNKPLVLENITYIFDIPGSTMSHEQFLTRVTAATGCGILLDVTNLKINSVNHGFDPLEVLERMPLDSVVQVHLAGGFWSHGVLIDGHSELVDEDTWQLFSDLTGLVDLKASIIEHDADFPEDFTVLLDEVDRARSIMAASRGRADGADTTTSGSFG
jgi:uncharacterized protein (UPF0276 family)